MSRYWLNPTIDDPDQFTDHVQRVADLYRDAPGLAADGVHVHSCDEMTGIPAREPAHSTRPMTPGKVERREFEYLRHGTSGLIASRDVVTGKVEAPLIQPTRTEADFAKHIAAVVPSAPHLVVVL